MSSIMSFVSNMMSSLPNLSSLPSMWIWIGIVLCILQSAMFSGLNLAVFSVSQLRLQIEADGGNADAVSVLNLRKHSNQVLATIIWGNVTTNVLLTLLSDSVLAGIAGFLFSAFAITMLGEIIPQAYFSRNALRMTARFLSFLNFYHVVLYPLAKPTGLLLDWWLGVEGPIIVRDLKTRLGEVIGQMKVLPERPGDDVIHHDIILVWGAQRRIITGSDLLGRLLRDIATVVTTSPQPPNAATPAVTMARAAEAAM
jgi:hypothetical protein